MVSLPTSPKRILIVARDMLGDLVNTTGAVVSIANAYPGSSLEIECGPAGLELFKDLNATIHVRGRHPGLIGRLNRIVAYSRSRYDLAIILDDSHDKARLLRAGKAKYIVGCHKGKPELFDRAVQFDPHRHDLFETLKGVLSLLEIEQHIAPILPKDFSSDKKGPSIGFYVGSSDEKKSWPAESWISLAKLVKESCGVPEVFGGPTDTELIAEVAKHAEINVPPPTSSLKDLSQRISQLQALVVADTGPAHLAAALGVPAVVLYGPTDPIRFHPWGQAHVALREDNACEHYGKGCAHLENGVCSRTCMTAILPQTVNHALHNLLK